MRNIRPFVAVSIALVVFWIVFLTAAQAQEPPTSFLESKEFLEVPC